MQGHFDLQLLHTPGLTRELLEAVRREGGDQKVEEYLSRFSRDGEWKTDNLVYQTFPGFLYWQGLGAAAPYWGTGSASSPGALCFIQLASTSSEPVYTTVDSYNNYASENTWWYSMPDTVTTSAVKRFIDDCIVTPEIRSDAAGREAIYGKFKWLFLPGEATSDQIRSIGAFYCSAPANVTATQFQSKGRSARVRIKDSGGNPVTINKLATKSLLVEYTFTMASL